MRAFWLLVLAPLAIAGYLAVRLTDDGAALRRHELQGLLDARLADVRTRVGAALAAIERELGERLAEAPATPDELRTFGRRIPAARQVFRVDARGTLVYPMAADASHEELEFLERTASIWSGRAILGVGAAPTRGKADSLVALAAHKPSGWLTWYWAEGVHLLYWRRATGGGVVGAELERIAVLARIVGSLPTSSVEEGRMELADSRGETVHQWGQLDDPTPPDATLALEPPLDSWQLRYSISPTQRAALSAGDDTALYLGLGAIGLVLLVLALYIYREVTRRLRDAAARVGFVTRVSHELRTPLTNIRLYAELLDENFDEDDDPLVDLPSVVAQRRRAQVIVTESQRLGRLLDNVLAFARHQRGKLVVGEGTTEVDDIVRGAVARFEPMLAARGIAVQFELGAPPPVRAARDTVDQIVVNLLSNVEKYAAGGEVLVSTREEDGRAIVRVADRGPGIAPRERDAVFEPFHRASDSLTGTNGTGIGLAISRELARAAGGDLALVDSERGAAFELTLPAEAP